MRCSRNRSRHGRPRADRASPGLSRELELVQQSGHYPGARANGPGQLCALRRGGEVKRASVLCRRRGMFHFRGPGYLEPPGRRATVRPTGPPGARAHATAAWPVLDRRCRIHVAAQGGGLRPRGRPCDWLALLSNGPTVSSLINRRWAIRLTIAQLNRTLRRRQGEDAEHLLGSLALSIHALALMLGWSLQLVLEYVDRLIQRWRNGSKRPAPADRTDRGRPAMSPRADRDPRRRNLEAIGSASRRPRGMNTLPRGCVTPFSFLIWRLVLGVPMVATTWARPCWWAIITSV